jgi:hypothetical protein
VPVPAAPSVKEFELPMVGGGRRRFCAHQEVLREPMG